MTDEQLMAMFEAVSDVEVRMRAGGLYGVIVNEGQTLYAGPMSWADAWEQARILRLRIARGFLEMGNDLFG